jgi:asparagine N-glycosylation enzyme membrane subunit Stt3
MESDDGLTPEAIEEALKETPRGAFALAGITVGLLMAAWLAIYFFVFLPRGQVG